MVASAIVKPMELAIDVIGVAISLASHTQENGVRSPLMKWAFVPEESVSERIYLDRECVRVAHPAAFALRGLD